MYNQPSDKQELIEASAKNLFELLKQADISQNQLKQLIDKALDQGMDINIQNERGYTLLHGAILSGKYDIVELLLEKNANTNICDKSMSTPLNKIATKHFSQKEDIYIAKLLLQKGASTELVDVGGWTPIQNAVCFNKIELTELLIDYGANLNVIVSGDFFDSKNLIEIALSVAFSAKDNPLQALLKLATACQNNDFGLVDYSVKKENSDAQENLVIQEGEITKEDIEKFVNHKISIKPSIKLLPKYLKELMRLKDFLGTKEEFVKNNTVKRLEDNINLKSTLKYAEGIPEDLIESLEEHGLKLAGDVTEQSA